MKSLLVYSGVIKAKAMASHLGQELLVFVKAKARSTRQCRGRTQVEQAKAEIIRDFIHFVYVVPKRMNLGRRQEFDVYYCLCSYVNFPGVAHSVSDERVRVAGNTV